MIKNLGDHYLYRHINLETGEPFYIGIGKKRHVLKRKSMKSEYHRAYTKKSRSDFWNNIVNKTEYEVEILLESDDYDFIKQKEIEFIALYGRRDLGKGTLVNLTDGGDGKNKSESTLQKLRNFHTGRPGLSGNKNPMYGKTGELNPNFGNFWSKEQKEKASLTQRNVNRNGGNNGRALKTINIITGTVYDSRVDAASAENYEKDNLINKILGIIYNNTPIMYLHEYEKGLKINHNCNKKFKYKYYIDIDRNEYLGSVKEISSSTGVDKSTVHLKIKTGKLNCITTDKYVDMIYGKVININTLCIYDSLLDLHNITGLDKNLLFNNFGKNIILLSEYIKENPHFKPQQ